MPYTLAMFLFWGILMALVGFVIGWLLCRVRARSRSGDRAGSSPRRDEKPSTGSTA